MTDRWLSSKELLEMLTPAIELGLVEVTLDAAGDVYYRVPQGVNEEELLLALTDLDEGGQNA